MYHNPHSLVSRVYKSVQSEGKGFNKVIYCGDTLIQRNRWQPVREDVSSIGEYSRVRNLFHSRSRKWDAKKIWQIFMKYTATEILGTHISEHSGPDQYHWIGLDQGKPSAKSIYALIVGDQEDMKKHQVRHKF